jgi:hypothetical protein
MGAKIQAIDIFQTPLSSHYPLPLRFRASNLDFDSKTRSNQNQEFFIVNIKLIALPKEDPEFQIQIEKK